MNLQVRFIEPLDVLNFRGNKSFGEGGEHGESQMPPRTSIFAGALRSDWLAQRKIDLAVFGRNEAHMSEAMTAQLGSPSAPGSFRIQTLFLARRSAQKMEVFMPLPADVVVLKNSIHSLNPIQLPTGLNTSASTPKHAVLRSKAAKPLAGKWLNQNGIAAYLRGKRIEQAHLIDSSEIWKTDERLGIALDVATRTAEEGRLYTTESIAMGNHIGFLVSISGADDLPAFGTLRLGGDGRGAHMQTQPFTMLEPDWELIRKEKRFRVLLSTPGLFPAGWVLPGATADNSIQIGNATGKLVCAAVSRFQVISGWDLALWQPKSAERITPAGSVYWIDNWNGDSASLQELTTTGIGLDILEPSRRAEGFNNIMIANWAA